MSIRHEGKIIAGFGGGGNGESISNQNPSSDIAQVYNWVGTYAEYIDQDIEVLHPDWVCYIIDDELGDEQDYQIVQYTARNVGDIFYTSRKDSFLNGAVECDGNTYSIHDFAGPDSIGNLLKANKIPYVSMTQYSVILAEKGNIGVFGWDGGENTLFRVPYLKDIFLEAGKANELGNYIAAGLPNITGSVSAARQKYDSFPDVKTGAFVGSTINGQTAGFNADRNNTGEVLINFDASSSSSVYGNSSTVQPAAVRYRPMIQLSTGFNDTAIENCNSVKADVEHINNSVTNCIIEIPQDIKLERDVNGTSITLKAGSVLYIPNGFETDGTTPKFTKYVTTQDYTDYPSAGNGTDMYCFQIGEKYPWQSDERTFLFSRFKYKNSNYTIFSGDTAPTCTIANSLWYDTANNIIKCTADAGSTWKSTCQVALPLGIVTWFDNKFVAIDQVFNGAGFIGECAYFVPGMKVLAPNGKNLDGTANNYLITTQNVYVRNSDNSNETIRSYYQDNIILHHNGKSCGFWCANDCFIDRYPDPKAQTWWYTYNSSNNKQYYSSDGANYIEASAEALIGYVTRAQDSTPRITGLYLNNQIDYKLQTVDDHRVVEYMEPTANNNYLWYRLYADGWVEQGGTSTSGTDAATMNLPIAMANDKYVLLGHMVKAGTSMEDSNDIVPRFWNRTATSFNYRLMSVNGSSGYERDWCWQVSGIAAL